jgi:hypothetical protein
MRISLMIGTGGGDGGSPVDHYVDEPPCHVTTGSGRVWSSQLPSSGFVFVYYAGSGALLRFAGRTVARRWRAAVVVGQALGLFTACTWPIPYEVNSSRHRDPTRSI